MSGWRDRLPEARGKLLLDAELAPFTWLRVGGLADVLFLPADADDLRDVRFIRGRPASVIAREVDALVAGDEPDLDTVATLFSARGADFGYVCKAADGLRSATVGDVVSYAVVRNINYTNICSYKCGFCAFSKGKTHEALRGAPYLLDLSEIQRAW